MITNPDPARSPQPSRHPSRRDNEAVPWLGLAQILIGTALLVLFGVMLNRTAEQTRRLERLELRLRNLENVRSLERTSALEVQLRKMLARLQVVEGGQQRFLDQLGDLQALTEERERERRDNSPLILPAEPSSAERPGSLGEKRPGRIVDPQPPELLRPPANGNP